MGPDPGRTLPEFASYQLRIEHLAGTCPADRLFAAERGADRRLCLDRDWRGAPAPVKVRALLVLDDAHLHLATWLPGPVLLSADAVPGRFRSGLWRTDVVELFLGDVEGEGYREYHLSPDGEWWMGCFSAPRISTSGGGATDGEPEEAGHAAQVLSEPDGPGRRGVLSLPRELLPRGFADLCGRAAGCRGMLAAILGPEPRLHLSSIALPGDRPDFHQPRLFPHVASASVCDFGPPEPPCS
jgi:hypothetical protein